MTQARATRWDELPELPWRDASRSQLEQLHAELLERGESLAVANGLIGFLVAGQGGSDSVKAKYRGILRDIGAPGATPPKRRRDRRSERGHIRPLSSIAGVAGSAALMGLVAVATHSPDWAPIILEREPQKATQRLCRVSPLRSEPACGVSPDHLATSTGRIGRREAAECARDARRGSPAMRIEHAPAA